MINPISPQNAENWAADFAKRFLLLISEAEALDAYAEHNFTEEARQAGALIQGFDDERNAVTWTSAQLSDAVIRYQNIGDIVRLVNRRNADGKSTIQIMREMARPERA